MAAMKTTGMLSMGKCTQKKITLRQSNPAKIASKPACRGRAAGHIVCENRSDKLWIPNSSRPEADIAQSASGPYPVQDITARQSEPPPAHLMERFQSVLGNLFQERIVRLGGAVDDDMANLIVAQLLYLDSADANTDIKIYVNSPGGSVTAGMAIFDTMRYIRPDCSTICVGLAASMGAFLLSSGTPGKRLSLPNSRIMIHQPLGGAQGQAADIEIQANEIMHHKATLSAYIAEFSGQTLEKIIVDTDRDFFMSAEEAKEYGLIDMVVTTPEQEASKQIEMYPKYELKYD